MDRQHIELLRERLDLHDVYEALTGRQIGRRRKNMAVRCPFHDDRSPSLSLSPQFWMCHAGCGHGDAFHFIEKALNCDFPAALAWAESFTGNGTAPAKPLKAPVAEPEAEPLAVLPAVLAERYHAALTGATRVWFHSRGLTDETVDRYRLGWGVPFRSSIQYPRYVIPFFDTQGQLRTFRFRRAVDGDDGPKYVGATGVPTFLFGTNCLPDGADWCFLCGSQIDAMLLAQMGFPAIAGAGETSFKAGWVDDLTALGIQRLYVLFDADEAGRRGARRVWEVCREYLDVRVCAWPGHVPHKADVGQMVTEHGWQQGHFERLLKMADAEAQAPRLLVRRNGRRSTRVRPLDVPVPDRAVTVETEDDLRAWYSVAAKRMARRIAEGAL